MDYEYKKLKDGYIDFISGIVLLLFSILVFVYGIYIINTMNLGKGIEWYASPALMPLFIGLVLGILSVLLILKKKKLFIEYKENNKDVIKKQKNVLNIKDILLHYKDNQFIRFIITLVLLVIYIFVFIGRIPFVLATFIYLLSNMVFFREDGFAIWKLIIISIIVSLAINYGFSLVAKIPMP